MLIRPNTIEHNNYRCTNVTGLLTIGNKIKVSLFRGATRHRLLSGHKKINAEATCFAALTEVRKESEKYHIGG